MLMLDTNAVIGYLGGDHALVSCIDTRGPAQEIGLATIVVVEMLGYPAMTEEYERQIEEFLDVARMIDLTPSLARSAARLRRRYHLTTADAVIAVAAIEANAPLVTRDKKFPKISELTCIVP